MKIMKKVHIHICSIIKLTNYKHFKFLDKVIRWKSGNAQYCMFNINNVIFVVKFLNKI